ncbi:MAG TPA: DUF4118 domain-containing protein [Phototrophicaceae bacterium]|nr:DUF4118 domain-containing protein [Phototrophicaceae bacterium]
MVNPPSEYPALPSKPSGSRRGQHTIFFGSAPGVGKTYRMLDAAQTQRAAGVDVIVGYIETHQRPDTQPLLNQLTVLPLREITEQGLIYHEFDLDAALQRKPELLLIDELAHKNAPGSRHQDRWQDVNELLDAGINIFTTLNVQHLESLTDVIERITGIRSRETVPDTIFEQADQVELVDVSVDILQKRLGDGKVFNQFQSAQAAQTFFRGGNLMALRELALRSVADRVSAQMLTYRQDHRVEGVWATNERILVCIGPNTAAVRLVRTAKRMATGLHAQWITVFVEKSDNLHYTSADRAQIARAFRLTEDLGGETALLNGENVAQQLIDYARQRNASRIVIGKPVHTRWRDLLFGSVVDELIRTSGEIDVYVISGDPNYAHPLPEKLFHRAFHLSGYATAVLVILIVNMLAGLLLPYLPTSILMMAYPLEIIFVAGLAGLLPAIFTAVTGVIIVSYFFMPPRFSFSDFNPQEALQLLIMLIFGMIISLMVAQLRRQTLTARDRERRLTSVFKVRRDLFAQKESTGVANAAVEYLRSVYHANTAILLADADGKLTIHPPESASFVQGAEVYVAQWVYEHGQAAGAGTENLPISKGFYLPLTTPGSIVGVLGIFPLDENLIFSPEQQQILATLAGQIALALEEAPLPPAEPGQVVTDNPERRSP